MQQKDRKKLQNRKRLNRVRSKRKRTRKEWRPRNLSTSRRSLWISFISRRATR